MTNVQIRKFVYEYAIKKDLHHTVLTMKGILKRHQEIGLRVPEMTSLGRLMG